MTVEEVYKEAQQLSAADRRQLFALLLDEIVAESPNTVRSREQLIELLDEGMRSPVSAMTSQDWSDIRRDVLDRSARRKGLPTVNP
jgi:hypothetical protein